MAQTPLVSVIVPAHNAADHLGECIAAILASDFERAQLEVIVVDDASTDSTRSIAAQHADRVISTGECARGPAFARNLGAREARGMLLAFVDADVTPRADALMRMADRLSSDSSLVAVFGSYDDSPAEDGLVSRYRNLLHHFAHHQSAGRVATFWAGCGMVRADAFAAARGFDAERYARPQIEDIELGYRLNRIGGIVLDPSIQCTHRKRWTPGSIVRTDFRDRAVPWVRLLLSRERIEGASSPSLGAGALVASASVGVALVLSLVAILMRSGEAAIAAGMFLTIAIYLGSNFYRFLFRNGGFPLIAVGIPLHLVYQLVSAAAVPIGTLLYIMRDRSGTRRASPDGIAGMRFFPLAFGETGARIIAFVATAYLARTLGASAFGMIGFAVALVAHFGIALAVGVGEVGARDVARNPEKTSAIAATAITLRLAVAVVAIAAIISLSMVLRIDQGTRVVTWLYAFSVIPLALDTAWAYKGLGRTRPVGYALLLSQAVALAAILLVVKSDDDVAKVPIVQVAGDLFAAAFLLVPLMRGSWHIAPLRAIGDIARRSGTITVSRVLRTVVVSFDVVLLGLLVTAREVGLYSAAYRVVFFVMAIIYASHAAFLPEVARSATEPRALSRLLSRAIGLALAVTIPFVVGGVLVAPNLMDLIFGAEYRAGSVPLQLLLSALLLFGIHGATRNVFLAVQRLGIETLIVAAGVVVNVVLNLLLIPRYGITGSAIATVAGEAAILIGLFAVLWNLGIRPAIRPVAPAVVAGLAMAGVLAWFGVDRPAWQSVPVGALSYVIVLGSVTLVSRHRAPSLVPEAR